MLSVYDSSFCQTVMHFNTNVNTQCSHTTEFSMAKNDMPLDDDDDDIRDEGLSDDEASKLDRTINTAVSNQGERVRFGEGSETLHLFIKLVNRILHGSRLPYTVAVRGHIKRVVRSTMVGDLLRLSNTYQAEAADDLHLAPHLQLFLDVLSKHEFRHCCSGHPEDGAGGGRIVAEVANSFVVALRSEARRQKIRKKVSDWKKGAKDNQERLKPYLDSLFDRYARLAVIRIDLSYKRSLFDASEEMVLSSAVNYAVQGVALPEGSEEARAMGRCHVDIREIMADRERLFENMRGKPSLFKYMVGHVCSIEWSRVGGYHMHLALFFDGSKVQKHEWLADEIGKYWVDVITDGRGLYFNCNREQYPMYFIGMVDHRDAEKRLGLLQCLEYLAKVDQFVQVKPSVKCKTFTTGHMPKPSGNGGRPRVRSADRPASPGGTDEADRPEEDVADSDDGPC